MANHFQDTVIMDLKIYHWQNIFPLIGLCTCLSATTFIPNKNKETIIKHIFHVWIAVYGTPYKFLTDNGSEFANSKLLEMTDHLSITVHNKVAESPWSDVERNNQTLPYMMDKLIAKKTHLPRWLGP